jgi:peptidoglycan hydrolase CwlO-like protein
MNKRIFSILVTVSVMLAAFSTVVVSETTTSIVSEEYVLVDLWAQGITDEQLAEMVQNGEIPLNVTELLLGFNLFG